MSSENFATDTDATCNIKVVVYPSSLIRSRAEYLDQQLGVATDLQALKKCSRHNRGGWLPLLRAGPETGFPEVAPSNDIYYQEGTPMDSWYSRFGIQKGEEDAQDAWITASHLKVTRDSPRLRLLKLHQDKFKDNCQQGLTRTWIESGD